MIQILARKCGLEPGTVQLSYDGQVLNPEQNLRDCVKQSGERLQLIYTVHGAGTAIELHTNPAACDHLGSSGERHQPQPDTTFACLRAKSAEEDADIAEKDAATVDFVLSDSQTAYVEPEEPPCDSQLVSLNSESLAGSEQKQQISALCETADVSDEDAQPETLSAAARIQIWKDTLWLATLFAYSTISETAIKLCTCRQIGNEYLAFYATEYECFDGYNGWQYPLFILLVGVVLFPFWVVLNTWNHVKAELPSPLAAPFKREWWWWEGPLSAY